MLAQFASVPLALVLAALLTGPASAQQTPTETPPASGSSAPLSPAPSPAPAPSSAAGPTSPPAAPAAPAAPPTAQAPPPPAAAQPAPPEQGTPAIVLSPEESEGIIGKYVRSAAGEDMGRIVDIIVSANNQPRAAVIDFGGFLGVGSRKIAVDWRLLQYSRTGKTWGVTSVLTRNQVRVSPEYKPGEPVVVLGLPAAAPPAAPAQPPIAPQAPAAQAPSSPPAPASPPPTASAPPAQSSGSGSSPAPASPAPSNPPASTNPPPSGPSGQEGAGQPSRTPQ